MSQYTKKNLTTITSGSSSTFTSWFKNTCAVGDEIDGYINTDSGSGVLSIQHATCIAKTSTTATFVGNFIYNSDSVYYFRYKCEFQISDMSSVTMYGTDYRTSSSIGTSKTIYKDGGIALNLVHYSLATA